MLDEVELRDGAVAVELDREEREGDLGRAGPFADADHSEHVGEPLLLKGFAVDPPARPGVALGFEDGRASAGLVRPHHDERSTRNAIEEQPPCRHNHAR
ncbi:MAG: hypothetical protein E6I20_07305 [Chloroflexi bacterium]|nr:MAG: hypothetical protein E6I20_07305 [Chloroflexota bacterium]